MGRPDPGPGESSPQHRPALSAPRRGFVALGLLAMGALLALNGAQIASAAYQRVAERHVPANLASVDAARIAGSLAPWSSGPPAAAGWAQASGGHAEAAIHSYARALRSAPGDALLWIEFAQALARLGRFGDTMGLAVARARTLAPASPPIRRAVAELGLVYWSHGTPALRTAWLAAMREELAVNRGAFLARVLTHGRTRTFCAEAAATIGAGPWCDSVVPRLAEGCYDVKVRGPVPCASRR